MEKSSSNKKLGQVQVRLRSRDRLRRLPEPILYHILSFLDSKSAVQTSVLSRYWNRAWKHVPDLHLRRDSFRELSSFRKFVSDVLHSRYHLNLRKVSCVNGVAPRLDLSDESMFRMVFKYALSHDVQHLVVDTGYGSIYQSASYRFSDLFPSITNCNVKNLELRYVGLDDRVFGSSGFQMLESLSLSNCLLLVNDQAKGEDMDLFSKFPCLTSLAISSCPLPCLKPEVGFKIHGLQLLSLKLDGLEAFKIDVLAPKLRYLSVRQPETSRGFSKLTLPSLDHADILVCKSGWLQLESCREEMQQHFHSLFQGLHNAKSLKLDAYAIQVLNKIGAFLDQQPSHLWRLESLTVATDKTPYKVANYLFKGSSCEEPVILNDPGK